MRLVLENFDFYIERYLHFFFRYLQLKQFLNEPLDAARVDAAAMLEKHNNHGYKECIISYPKPNPNLKP